MPQILRLEYACTPAELRQAQSLNLRMQIGGGSKWRTTLLLLVVLGGMLLSFYFRMMREVAPAYRPAFFAAVVGISLVAFVVLRKRNSRRAAPVTTRLELSGTDITILGPDSRVTMPWSAFPECQESPDLFVLVDRAKRTLLVIPKRAFPSESWQTWFRDEANVRLNSAEQPQSEAPLLPASPHGDWVRFTVRLGFRDYLDRTNASWRTRGFFLAMAGMFAGVGAYTAANPPPNAIYTAPEVFFMFVLPILLVTMAISIFIVALYSWLANLKYSAPQQVVISEDSIVFSAVDAQGALPWTVYTRYKETWSSFILWNHRGSAWTIFPKRAFESYDDVSRCRALLARHLLKSRWFFG